MQQSTLNDTFTVLGQTVSLYIAQITLTEALSKGIIPVLNSHEEPMIVLPENMSNTLEAWVEHKTFPQLYKRLYINKDQLIELLSRLERTLKLASTWSDFSEPLESSQETQELSVLTLYQDTHPIVKTVNTILIDAYQQKASDIHFENNDHALTVKYRLDGILNHIKTFNKNAYAKQIISRIKVLAQLDISEQRIPQDGRFKVKLEGREVDFRISIMPGLHGEDAVLRILDKQHITGSLQALSLEALGFSVADCTQIRQLSNMPYGMCLLTGPTGSGKTTSLYAILSELHSGLEKIISIEDPVEYQLTDVLQIPVNEKKGLTFAKGLRSILRHDPDRIMVGEIRDAETAEIAIQAALTGHAVYTTLHANTVFDVINRFRHMQIDIQGFVSALNGIIAQRLVRLICLACKVPDTDTHNDIPASTQSGTLYKGLGCEHCRYTGYHNRQAVCEILTMNDALREAVLGNSSITHLKHMAKQYGSISLYDRVWMLVHGGLTTVEEAKRVTFTQEH